MNVFKTYFMESQNRWNLSIQGKIVFTGLSNTVFRFEIPFSIAELCRFLLFLLAGYSLYLFFLLLCNYFISATTVITR